MAVYSDTTTAGGLANFWAEQRGGPLAPPLEGECLVSRATPNFCQQFVILLKRNRVRFKLPTHLAYMGLYIVMGILGGLLGGLEILRNMYGYRISANHSGTSALFLMGAGLPGYFLLSPDKLPARREASSGVSMPAFFCMKSVG